MALFLHLPSPSTTQTKQVHTDNYVLLHQTKMNMKFVFFLLMLTLVCTFAKKKKKDKDPRCKGNKKGTVYIVCIVLKTATAVIVY